MVVLILGIFFLMVPNVFAETIVLKNGTVLNSPIIEKSQQKIKVNVNSVDITYYVDDVRSINGLDPQEFLMPMKTEVTVPKKGTNVVAPVNAVSLTNSDPKVPKSELILKFIEVFGTKDNMTKSLNDLAQRVPKEQADVFKNNIRIDELIQRLMPIYDRLFTEEELTSYIRFYSSAEGQKLVQSIPLAMQESVGVSIQYFREKLPETSPSAK